MTNNSDKTKTRGALGILLEKHEKIEKHELHNKKQKAQPSWISQLHASIDSESIKPFSDNFDIANLPKEGLVFKLDTTYCAPWMYADRSEEEMGDINELAESIKISGQLEPILVRPSQSKTHKFDVIFGNRRLKAIQKIGGSVIAIVKHITDQSAALMQKEENEQRKDISDFSKAFHYKKLLDDKIFSSEIELANSLKIPKQTLNNLFAFTRVPTQILSKIQRPSMLSQQMALKISILSKDKKTADIIENLAPHIGANKISSPTKLEKEIEKFGLTKKEPFKVIKIKNKTGKVVFTIRKDSSYNAVIVINKNEVKENDKNEIISFLKQYASKL